jgi:hypothetical protein
MSSATSASASGSSSSTARRRSPRTAAAAAASSGAPRAAPEPMPYTRPDAATQEAFDVAGDGLERAAAAVGESAEAALGGWHYAPLFVALAPAAGALFGGRADAWSDAILLLLAAFWLYQFLKGACGVCVSVWCASHTCLCSAARHLLCSACPA